MRPVILFCFSAFLLGCFLTKLAAQRPPEADYSFTADNTIEIYIRGAYAVYAVDGEGYIWWPLRGSYMQGNDVIIRITGMAKLPIDRQCARPSPVQLEFIMREGLVTSAIYCDVDGDGDCDLRDWSLGLPFWTGPRIPAPIVELPDPD